VSVRFPDAVAERLRRRARSQEPTSGLVVRLVDEGLRMIEHPGVMFRDGPAGRRAGLIGGPDVWEVVAVLRDAGSTPSDAIAETAGWLSLNEAQVRTAEAYYSAYPDEVDTLLAGNEHAAVEAAEASAVRDRLYRR
jgi:hypothetical protein